MKSTLCARKTREILVRKTPSDKSNSVFFPSAALPIRSCAIRVIDNPPPVMIPTCVYVNENCVLKIGKRIDMTARGPSVIA